jgi:hypothetical protein
MHPDSVSTAPADPSVDVDRRLVEALCGDGIAIARIEELFGDEEWSSLLADAEPFVAQSRAKMTGGDEAPRSKEDYILRRYDPPKRKGESRFDAPRPTLPLDSPLLRIGASDALLDVVNAYRDLRTTLYYADYWFTVPYLRASERVASQRWHRDPEDEHVVKAFLYLSDVDDGAGPFQYVRGSAAGGRYGDLWPWGESKRYPPPEELEAAVAKEDLLTLTGPAGTMIFCDTGGFHRGGFARTKPRVMATFTYVGSGSKAGARRFEVEQSAREAGLSPQVRYALGL